MNASVILVAAFGWCALLGQVPATSPVGISSQVPVAADAPPQTPADAAVALLRHGDYAQAQAAAEALRTRLEYEEINWRTEAEALLAQGHYEEARALLARGIGGYFDDSLRLHLLAHEANLYSGHEAEAKDLLKEAANLISGNRLPSRSSPQLLADAGEVALLGGADPKLVLDTYFNPAQQGTPASRDAFLGAGKLALDKHDYDLASRTFTAGLLKFPGDADLLWGMAASFRDGDSRKMTDYAQKALDSNPHHVPTMLILAEFALDSEKYDAARGMLDEILKINPKQAEALALYSVVTTLAPNAPNPAAIAEDYRKKALASWATNPKVDYLIGLKLAQDYRFEEGAAEERRALALDPEYNPARIQLAETLLRLGQEDEGWKLAADARKADTYDVEAFNLVSLHEDIANYVELNDNPHFHLRMSPEEAPIYGKRALDLLEKVRAAMTEKYGLTLDKPTLIEIYPNPQDFSVRTFGMPDIGEFLGVTFGPVVTINSPTSHDANWRDVMWHEFTHVVTLTLTHNKMPRWLSEGISVYEENQADPSWGQKMSLADYNRITTGKMQPISGMSAAFLTARSPADTSFAYFESLLVVQYLIEKHGLPKMKDLLKAVAGGQSMNAALESTYGPLPELDKDFAQYALDQAAKLPHGLDLTPPAEQNSDAADAGLVVSLTGNVISSGPAPADAKPSEPKPGGFYAKMNDIADAVDKKEWPEARDKLNEITSTGIYIPGPENPYILVAKVAREMKDTAAEKAALLTIVSHEADAREAVTRLLEIAQDEKDWASVARWGEAWVAINPTAPSAWRALFAAYQQLGKTPDAIEAGRVMVLLDPPDLPSVHYQLAKLYQPTDISAARRNVLEALEEAPRFHAAYDLLTSIPPSEPATAPTAAAATDATTTPTASSPEPTPVGVPATQ